MQLKHLACNLLSHKEHNTLSLQEPTGLSHKAMVFFFVPRIFSEGGAEIPTALLAVTWASYYENAFLIVSQ